MYKIDSLLVIPEGCWLQPRKPPMHESRYLAPRNVHHGRGFSILLKPERHECSTKFEGSRSRMRKDADEDIGIETKQENLLQSWPPRRHEQKQPAKNSTKQSCHQSHPPAQHSQRTQNDQHQRRLQSDSRRRLSVGTY